MAQDDLLSIPLQENLITVLAYNEKHGRIVCNSLDTKLMDGDFRTIAEACIGYWKEYDKPPGEHTADLLSHIIDDKGNRRAKGVLRLLRAMSQLADSNLNTEYVLKQIQDHQETQIIKAAVLESAELLQAKQHLANSEVKDMWHNLLKDTRRQISFDAGMRLDNPAHVLSLLAQFAEEFNNGIAMLDKRWIVPARKTLFMWLGASGRGKTWALVRQGVAALRRRKKVLHITLENASERTAQRYYQCLFSVPRRAINVEIATFDVDRRRLRGIEYEKYKYPFALDFGDAAVRILDKMRGYKGMYRNLVIKQFAPNTLTLAGLEAYMDMLEQIEGFVPDLVIVDYAGIMKVDPKFVRDSMGNNVLGLRAIAVDRNMAFSTAHQSNREGAKSKQINATHVAEAWPVVSHADNIVSFSSSDFEFRLGLCRGFVAKGRDEADKYAFLMTQNYGIGQFCLDSRSLDVRYTEIVKELEASMPDETGGNEDEDEEEEREAA